MTAETKFSSGALSERVSWLGFADELAKTCGILARRFDGSSFWMRLGAEALMFETAISIMRSF
ncbi:hypothetical protein [Roseivivax sp. CAU 1761]